MFVYTFILVLVFLCEDSIANKGVVQRANNNELKDYFQNTTSIQYLDRTFEKFGQLLLPSKLDLKASEMCIVCPLVANALIEERKLGMTDIQLTAEAIYFCRLLKIEDERVCEGVIEINTPIFGYIIDHNPNITGKQICGIIMETVNCPNADSVVWTVDIPIGNTIAKGKPTGKSKYRILHITDMHFDPLYTEGRNLDCNEPLCCQNDQEIAEDSNSGCGYWGSYTKADTPWQTILALFNHTTQDLNNKFDWVYFTGDVISHRVWSTSSKENQKTIEKIYDLFNEHFDVPVYFVLGNHEVHPVNVFSSEGVIDPSLSSQWLYDLMLSKSAALSPDDVQQTISKGGYYTVSPKQGFRLIVLNDNVCSVENWWLLHNNYDPYGQLAWMANILEQAEQNKEMVHVLAHIPTQSCLKTWATEYNKIINRFANTIVGQFYGHSHKDEFYVYYNQSDSSQALNVGWNGASVMADHSNPSYKIYDIDADTFQLLDIEEWTFNLTKANNNPNDSLDWYKLYSFQKSFEITSFDPTDIDALIIKMAKQHDLINLFYKYKYRNSDIMNTRTCDESCQKNILCSLVTTEFGVTERCESILKIYDENMS